MDGPTLIMVPGILGGVVIAVAIAIYRGHSRSRQSEQRVPSERLSTDVINMASIRVAGVGGLGLMAMAAAVAWNIPRIGQTIELGFLFGILMAVALIVMRHRFGAMPSSGRHGGANTMLAIDDREPTHESDSERLPERPKRITNLATL